MARFVEGVEPESVFPSHLNLTKLVIEKICLLRGCVELFSISTLTFYIVNRT